MPERYDLNVPTGDVIDIFEEACRELGLKVHRGSLAKYEESTHWHLTMSRQKGTLEATWWPTNHALWVEVRANRSADWMPEILKALRERF